MSWTAIAVLAAGAYAWKALGVVVLGRLGLHLRVIDVVGLLPAALLAGVIVLQTLTDGTSLVVDARLAGVAVGAVAAWRKAPLPVVLVVAAVTTALLRAVG